MVIKELDGPEWEDRVVILSPTCTTCKHLKDAAKRQCTAFPDGIPAAIWQGNNDHTVPYPRDKGIRYEEALEA